ncbi:MAG: bifunctional diaminohydroxyphosphoribosylaminopyrimidine deaminase/5-amino-6-(5-phosphoribosylamino)uracil reductase RibD [Nanoarchaeota archaeon]|nr:bifunctional diaminohydroxyphosphoribosylaminopyrimidine deaminase/5-amino-6-(5-phosphoribosylamino)uracil reductase RibD [Nanoarchaeota archaeon]
MRPHKKYMELCLKLAEKGKGATSPNPLVGAILVKRGAIVGKGWHKKCGEDHAEVMAIKQAGIKANNATLYVNLEPCSHWGRTPPCTESIIQAGIREVIVGCEDPNPKVSGHLELKSRGLKTKIGILDDECRRINETYLKYMKTKKPFVIVKAAMSLDGKIATKTGHSKYITGTEARKHVHQLRSELDAIMVGSNTVMKDDPMLTTRLVKGKNPIKIVVDSKLKLNLNSNVVKNEPSKLIVATTNLAPRTKVKQLQQKGVKIIEMPADNGHVDLKKLMKELGNHEITSIMIEGGAELNSHAIKSNIVDKLLFFLSPGLIGDGLSALGDMGITKVDKSIKLKNVTHTKIGKDLLIEGYL